MLTGIDIGTTAVKVTALAREGDGVRRVAEGAAPLPPGAVSDGLIEDPETVARTLKSALGTLGLSGTDAVIALPFVSGGFTRDISDPVPSDISFETWARELAEEASPFEPQETVLAALRAPVPGVSARFVVGKRAVFESFRDVVQDSGARLVDVDLDVLALARLHRLAHPREDADGAVAVLDVGAAAPKIVVALCGRILLTNVFARTPDQFLSELPEMVATRLRTRIGDGVVTRVRLSGGASPLSGLREALASRLGIPVEPLGTGDLPFPDEPAAAVARGVALRLLLPGVSALESL